MTTFLNKATLSYNGLTVNSNTTTGELVDVLTVTKMALEETYLPGDTIAYAVSIVNSGEYPFTSLSVTDTLGAYQLDTKTLHPLTYTDGSLRYFRDGRLQTAPTVGAGPDLSVTGIAVPARGNAILLYTATINEFAPPHTEGRITNQVTVSGAELSSPIQTTEEIASRQTPELTISKSLNPLSVTENGEITYTFVVENHGNTAADDAVGIVIRDTFDPILNPISVTLDGNPLTVAAGQYTYQTATGVFSTTTGVVTVPAAQFKQDAATGAWAMTPGVAVLTVTGTV